ncbi:MAG: hypothetical protein ACRC42_03375 [Mycoplasma sp.]
MQSDKKLTSLRGMYPMTNEETLTQTNAVKKKKFKANPGASIRSAANNAVTPSDFESNVQANLEFNRLARIEAENIAKNISYEKNKKIKSKDRRKSSDNVDLDYNEDGQDWFRAEIFAETISHFKNLPNYESSRASKMKQEFDETNSNAQYNFEENINTSTVQSSKLAEIENSILVEKGFIPSPEEMQRQRERQAELDKKIKELQQGTTWGRVENFVEEFNENSIIDQEVNPELAISADLNKEFYIPSNDLDNAANEQRQIKEELKSEQKPSQQLERQFIREDALNFEVKFKNINQQLEEINAAKNQTFEKVLNELKQEVARVNNQPHAHDSLRMKMNQPLNHQQIASQEVVRPNTNNMFSTVKPTIGDNVDVIRPKIKFGSSK